MAARYGEEVGRLEVGGWSGSYWWREVARIWDGVGEEEDGWFAEKATKKVGNGAGTFFWYDRWLGGIPLCHCFSRSFDLAENKSITVATSFSLGWEEGARRGGGRGDCGRGKKLW